jgi:hypothetical protein
MAFGTITSTSNTFGSVDGTATGSVPGTLSGSVGVPGPQGPAGATGPAGPAGQGVPAGGTTGQVLAKVDGDDYNTEWIDVDVSDKRDLTDYDFTNVANTYLTTFGLTLEPTASIDIGTFNSSVNALGINIAVDESQGGTIDAPQYESFFNYQSAQLRTRNWIDGTADAGLGITVSTNKVFFTNYAGSASGFMQYGNGNIIFGNGSVQTIAFPGFNNAALTGNPTAPTATFGDNDTSIATTAFVQAGLLGGTANARNLEVQVRNQSGSTIPAGSIVYISGATGNLPLITLAQANNDANSAQTIGFVKTSISNNGTGYVIVRGVLEAIDTSALTEGVQLYLSPTTAGTWTTTKPSAPQHLVYVGVVIRSHPTQGTILVAVQNGYELHELHDVALASEANNDLLVYELSTDLWKNKSFATLGLAGLNSPTFTGTPSLPTGTIGVTQTAGDNTTALATTAFVTASNPDASTTVKGHVELATNAEVIAGTSTTTAIVPGNAGFLLTDPRLRSLAALNGSAVQGSGTASANAGFAYGREMYLSSLATGRAAWLYGLVGVVGFNSSIANRNQIDFSKKVWMSGYACFGSTFSGTAYMGDANTMCRITLGGYSTNTTGDMTLRGIGLKKVGGVGSFVTLTVHNGTTLTDVATTVAVADGAGINWVIYSDGTGNVTLYINGTQAATTTAGPTSATASNAGCYREQVEAAATPGVRQALNIGAGGGWLYLEG